MSQEQFVVENAARVLCEIRNMDPDQEHPVPPQPDGIKRPPVKTWQMMVPEVIGFLQVNQAVQTAIMRVQQEQPRILVPGLNGKH